MKKKVRKPRKMWDMFLQGQEFYVHPIGQFNLYYAKRLNSWLTKAITYLESRNK